MSHHPENCKEVFALLSEYLNLELPPEACRQIEDHLADCSPCVEFVKSLRKTVDLCRQFEPKLMPAPLSAQAKSELEEACRKMMAARAAS